MIIQFPPEVAQTVPMFEYRRLHEEHPSNFYNGKDCCNSQMPVTDALLSTIIKKGDVSSFRGFSSAHYLIEDDVSGFYLDEGNMFGIASIMNKDGLVRQVCEAFRENKQFDLDTDAFLPHTVQHRYPQMRAKPGVLPLIEARILIHPKEYWKIDTEYTLLLLTDRQESFAALTVINKRFKDMARDYVRRSQSL